MEEVIAFLNEFNWITICIRLALAVLAGGIVGVERGRHGRAAGLRTHIMVCIGAAMTALVGIFVYRGNGMQGDSLRIAAQVVSGIGFLGAGMIIIKSNHMITGLTTAAGMWTTAIIGIALGYGFYLGAAVTTIFCVITATVFSKLERRRKGTVSYYLETEVSKRVGAIEMEIRQKIDENALILTVSPKSNVPNTIGLQVSIHNHKIDRPIREILENIPGIRFVVEE